MPRKRGSTTALTIEVQKAICDALVASVPDKYAAEASGISERTFRDWIAKGESGIEPYASFRAAVTRARARAVVNLTKKALRGDKGCSQATWFLERRYRQDYGPSQKIELGGDPEGVPIEHKLDQLTTDELRKLAGGP